MLSVVTGRLRLGISLFRRDVTFVYCEERQALVQIWLPLMYLHRRKIEPFLEHHD